MLAALKPYVYRPEICMIIFNQGGQAVNYQQEMERKMMTENAGYSNTNLHKEYWLFSNIFSSYILEIIIILSR